MTNRNSRNELFKLAYSRVSFHQSNRTVTTKQSHLSHTHNDQTQQTKIHINTTNSPNPLKKAFRQTRYNLGKTQKGSEYPFMV